MQIPFCKFEGAGNDFILLDDRVSFFPVSEPRAVVQLCHRQKGVGADGLVLLQSSTCADFKMQIYNADGSAAAMCGNGLRCLIAFLRMIGFPQERYRIETGAGVFHCRVEGKKVFVEHPLPSLVEESIELEGSVYKLYLLDTGVPHAIHFVEDLAKIDVEELGRKLRTHPRFLPEGRNITFAKVEHPQQVLMRTYERGVEAETLACGTAAAAAAFTAHKLHHLHNPIFIVPKSGDSIEVQVGSVLLEVAGSARCVYHGTLPRDYWDSLTVRN